MTPFFRILAWRIPWRESDTTGWLTHRHTHEFQIWEEKNWCPKEEIVPKIWLLWRDSLLIPSYLAILEISNDLLTSKCYKVCEYEAYGNLRYREFSIHFLGVLSGRAKKFLGNVWEKEEFNFFLFESGQYIVTYF